LGSFRSGALLVVALLWASTGILAETEPETEDEETPDLEFLEFLGIWDEDDYEWLLPQDEGLADSDERADPVAKGEESTETEDEI
jgi:hypothetical protein